MKTLFSLLLASFLFAFGAVQAEEGGLRYTIAVSKFDNNSRFPAGQFALPSTFAALLTDKRGTGEGSIGGFTMTGCP